LFLNFSVPWCLAPGTEIPKVIPRRAKQRRFDETVRVQALAVFFCFMAVIEF